MKSRTQEERGLRIALQQERISQEEFDQKLGDLHAERSRATATAVAEKPSHTPKQFVNKPRYFFRK